MPRHGFLLNNELTDFSTVYSETDPNRIQPGKRPRSSMSPTIVLRDGKPFLALGSPGGSTIITTVLQMLVNRMDLGMTVEEAIAAPRAAQRNTASIDRRTGVHRLPTEPPSPHSATRSPRPATPSPARPRSARRRRSSSVPVAC